MGFFSRKKKEETVDTTETKTPKGFYELEVKEVKSLTPSSVKVSFIVPSDLKNEFKFVPGQYLNLSAIINGSEERRSYSICSGEDEEIAVAIKRVNNGKFSNWANDDLKAGMNVSVAAPNGNFKLNVAAKNIVAFAAGSGITPMISMAKSLKKNAGSMKLFYGNRLQNSIMFHEELATIEEAKTQHFLTGEEVAGFEKGRLDKEKISSLIKADLELLKADGFYLCGPETMIQAGIEVLEMFGVAKDKIHFELYTTPVLLIDDKATEVNTFEGTSKVTIILDDEEFTLDIKAGGKTILDSVSKEGYDAPYSCRGGVCCTCRAKVLKGKATMSINYALTDEEVAAGYILTCQAHPASEEVLISYDE